MGVERKANTHVAHEGEVAQRLGKAAVIEDNPHFAWSMFDERSRKSARERAVLAGKFDRAENRRARQQRESEYAQAANRSPPPYVNTELGGVSSQPDYVGSGGELAFWTNFEFARGRPLKSGTREALFGG